MKRVTFIDQLRVIGAFAVVVLHAATVDVLAFNQLNQPQWWIANVLSSMTRWAVPVFMMISGAVLLGQSTRETWQEHWLKRFHRIGLPLAFWMGIYAVYYHFWRGDPLNLFFSLKRFIFDQPYEHLFFLVVLLQLAVITPWLRVLCQRLPRSTLSGVVGFLFFITLFWVPTRFIMSFFVPYLAYFVMGYYLLKVKVSPLIVKLATLSWMVAVLSTAIGTYLLTAQYIPNANNLYLYSYFNPLVMMASISIFLLGRAVTTDQEKQWLNQVPWTNLGHYTLGIYLLHPIWLDQVQSWCKQRVLCETSWWEVPAVAVITFTLSLVSVGLLKKLPFFHKVV